MIPTTKNIDVASRNVTKKNQPRQMPPVSSWIHPRKLLTRTISIVLLKFPPRLFVFSRIATPQNTFHIIFPQTRTVEWNVRDWKSCRIPQLVFRRLAVCSPKISSRFERGEKKNWDEKKEKLSAEKFTCVRNCDVENKKKSCCVGVDHVFRLHTCLGSRRRFAEQFEINCRRGSLTVHSQ